MGWPLLKRKEQTNSAEDALFDLVRINDRIGVEFSGTTFITRVEDIGNRLSGGRDALISNGTRHVDRRSESYCRFHGTLDRAVDTARAPGYWRAFRTPGRGQTGRTRGTEGIIYGSALAPMQAR